jgi:hypothetical protein
MTRISFLFAGLLGLVAGDRARGDSIAGAAGRPARDVFRIPAVQSSFTLGRAPIAGSILTVYLNGLLMAEGDDYTVAGQEVRFTSAAAVSPSSIVQVFYQFLG